MTDKEKLEKAIEFIQTVDRSPVVGEDQVRALKQNDNDLDQIEIDYKTLNSLKERAWHLLIDLTD